MVTSAGKRIHCIPQDNNWVSRIWETSQNGLSIGQQKLYRAPKEIVLWMAKSIAHHLAWMRNPGNIGILCCPSPELYHILSVTTWFPKVFAHAFMKAHVYLWFSPTCSGKTNFMRLLSEFLGCVLHLPPGCAIFQGSPEWWVFLKTRHAQWFLVS